MEPEHLFAVFGTPAPVVEDAMDEWSSAKLCDAANLILGVILFFSPWLFGLSPGAPHQIGSVVGLLIAVLSTAALAAFAVWEEWLNFLAGLGLIVLSWVLGFQEGDAMTLDVVVGAIVAALAAFEIWWTHDRSRESRRASPSALPH